MSASTADPSDKQPPLEAQLAALRPQLHRYCARMVGSVIDGEDVVQDALLKAVEASRGAMPIENPKGWLFRIAHNAALDHLRRRARRAGAQSDKDLDMIADPNDMTRDHEIAAMGLRTFMRLSAAQRSSVILKDVLGYSLDEIGAIMATTVPAVKAALHRGRDELHRLAAEPDDATLPQMSASERARLSRYVERFNARDFDSIRDMLADDVRLELVARTRARGRSEVAKYFHNYSRVDDWELAPAWVENRPALLVRDPRGANAAPDYFILLEWTDDHLIGIRDFRYARYVLTEADFTIVT